MMGAWKNLADRRLHLAVLAVIVLACFGINLVNDFVWDDAAFLLNVDAYRTFDLRRMLLSPGNGFEYLPVRDLSYALDYVLWGESSRGFHLTNLLLYLLNVITVYFLANKAAAYLFQTEDDRQPAMIATVAFWTAAAFAVHPLHCEAVAFVTGRNTLLSGLFTFLAAAGYLCFLDQEGRGRSGWYFFALCCFSLAVLSKASSIFLPPVLFLLPAAAGRRWRFRDELAALPFFVVAGGTYLVFTAIAREVNIIDQVLSRHGGLLFSRLAVAVQIPFFYLGKFLYPTGLSADYTVSFARSFASLPVVGAGLALAALIAALLWGRRRWGWALFSCIWFGAALVPVLNLLPTSVVVADRYAFIPSFALCFALGCGVVFVGRGQRRDIMTLAVAALLAVWGLLAFAQNRVWRTEESLWLHTAAVSPMSVKALVNLGSYYYTKGRYDESFALFDRARKIDGRDPSYQFFTGMRHYVRGEYGEAIRCFDGALLNTPDYISALYHLALSYDEMGDLRKAAEYYQKTLASNYPEAMGYKRKAAERLLQLRGF